MEKIYYNTIADCTVYSLEYWSSICRQNKFMEKIHYNTIADCTVYTVVSNTRAPFVGSKASPLFPAWLIPLTPHPWHIKKLCLSCLDYYVSAAVLAEHLRAAPEWNYKV